MRNLPQTANTSILIIVIPLPPPPQTIFPSLLFYIPIFKFFNGVSFILTDDGCSDGLHDWHALAGDERLVAGGAPGEDLPVHRHLRAWHHLQQVS
jgi:hypothetical protein